MGKLIPKHFPKTMFREERGNMIGEAMKKGCFSPEASWMTKVL